MPTDLFDYRPCRSGLAARLEAEDAADQEAAAREPVRDVRLRQRAVAALGARGALAWFTANWSEEAAPAWAQQGPQAAKEITEGDLAKWDRLWPGPGGGG